MTQTSQHNAINRPGTLPRHEPIFLLAPARSCSTVTLALLAGHPDIYGFPEMLLFTADTVGGLLYNQPHPSWRQLERVAHFKRSGILRAVAHLREKSQAEPAIRRTENWLAERSSWSPTQLMDHLLTLVYPQIGLEKSPDTVNSVQALDACMKSYPQARYIHLTRHPVSTQRSMQNHWRHRYRSEKALVAGAASAWYLAHSRIVRRLVRLPARQRIRVRVEDVLQEPLVWLPKLLEWLGLRSDDDLVCRMTHTENWQFANTGPSDNLYGGDSGFMRAPALRPLPDPGPVAFDPSWDLPEEMCDRMRALARYLGY